jgi:hypothetical protein
MPRSQQWTPVIKRWSGFFVLVATPEFVLDYAFRMAVEKKPAKKHGFRQRDARRAPRILLQDPARNPGWSIKWE